MPRKDDPVFSRIILLNWVASSKHHSCIVTNFKQVSLNYMKPFISYLKQIICSKNFDHQSKEANIFFWMKVRPDRRLLIQIVSQCPFNVKMISNVLKGHSIYFNVYINVHISKGQKYAYYYSGINTLIV